MTAPLKDEQALTRRILWKLDCRILPPLALLWLANFIDRSNIGNARIAGLEQDTHLVGNQFNTVLAVFYVSYLLIQVPSNLVLKTVKPNRWIPLLVCVWGMVTIMTCFVHSYSGLIAIRFFLGLCEGGLLPGIVLYLSTIYKPHELQYRVGVFYASASLSGAFGGLLASAILKMDGIGGLAGWRWIFVLEGLVTIIIGIFAAILLPTDILTAKFLTEEERTFALERFRSSNTTTSTVPVIVVTPEANIQNEEKRSHEGRTSITSSIPPLVIHQEHEEFEWREVIRGVLDIQTWLTGFAYLGLIVSLYSFSLFLPTIVAGLGLSGSSAQLHTVPPYVPATVLTVVVAIFGDRLKWRGPSILICLPFTITGYIMAIAAHTNQVRYAAVFLIAAGVYPCAPAILSILPNNSSGHYKKATTTALQLAIANTGGFVATFVYTSDQAPKYIRGHSIVLAFEIMAWIMTAANVLYCMWENKARKEGRRDENIEKYQKLWEAGKTRAPIGDRHPDFRFTL
ncbi:MFS general substrate transporter [Pluteus cervinus]|uniref:MFS general substrate transporter n=1 Tax=Pluteus cervinus TaxID=181527 RepID=A0ACD3BDC7_9AGAR|nr:MFS general substrate transporter [Pluteus cervinus]